MTSTGSHWRDACRPIIARIIAKNPSADEKELRRLISLAYPFGERKYHPYKIFLDEVNFQLHKPRKQEPSDPNQMTFLLTFPSNCNEDHFNPATCLTT